MTPEQQRIAIAEACGWCKSEEHERGHWPRTVWRLHGVEGEMPDYLNDLNAMHEAEQTLTDEQYTAYEDCMWSLMDPGWRDTPTVGGTTIKMPASRSRLSSATAAQRAEAFLRTIDKWKE